MSVFVVVNLVASSRTNDSLSFAWDAPVNCTPSGYNVTLWSVDTSQPLSVDRATTSQTFHGLTAGTQYTVGIDALCEEGARMNITAYTGQFRIVFSYVHSVNNTIMFAVFSVCFVSCFVDLFE